VCIFPAPEPCVVPRERRAEAVLELTRRGAAARHHRRIESSLYGRSELIVVKWSARHPAIVTVRGAPSAILERMKSPDKKRVRLSCGEIAYLETGSPERPPVLFVHGIPTSSYLWRHVLRFLQNDFHCYAPDLMGLGDTVIDVDTTALDMDAQAEMLVEFMHEQGHDEFAIVCHDQGGAAAQIIAARLPHKVTCLVLTDCVCYDNWPVPAIRRLQKMAQLPLLPELLGRVGFSEWLETKTRLSSFRKGVFDSRKLTTEAIREYLRPLSEGPEQRKRFRKFVLAGDSRYTELAVEDLRRFDKPTLVVWAADDFYLSPSWGRKLYEDIAGAERFELVPFCGHFWQEERPSEFSSIIGSFLAEHLLARPAAATQPRRLPVAEKTPSPS
jgi:pimeloyl-ACP methyl ester carboxylesterase